MSLSMNPIYRRWLLVNLNQLMRHMAVAISTWIGTGIVDGKIHWGSLWIAVIAGAFFPALIALLAKGIPISESDILIVPETKTTVEIVKQDHDKPTVPPNT